MIKVRAGQVWEFKKGANNYESGDRLRILDFDSECGSFDAAPINIVDPSDLYVVSDKFLNECFRFIPQNDLEFAAVTLDKWPPRSVQIHVKGGEILGCLLHNPNAINECQWQNMRYHLGLDKKPHYRLTGGDWVKV